VIGKGRPKIKPSEDQTPTLRRRAPPGPCALPKYQVDAPAPPRIPFDPRGPLPRGMTLMSFIGGSTTLRLGRAAGNVVNMLQNQAGTASSQQDRSERLSISRCIQRRQSKWPVASSLTQTPTAGGPVPARRPQPLSITLPSLTSAIHSTRPEAGADEGPVACSGDRKRSKTGEDEFR